MMVMSQSVFATSLAGRFEVSKTKLLFLIGTGKFERALAYAERVAGEGSFDTLSTELNLSMSGLAGPVRMAVYETEWRYWLGVANSRSNQLPEAAAHFYGLDPDLLFKLPLQFEYGVVLLRQKNNAAANSQFADWVAGHPKHNQGRYYLALTFFELGDYEAASILLAELDRDSSAEAGAGAGAGAIPPDQVLYLLASSFFRDDRYADAKTVIQRILNWPEGSRYGDAAQDLLTIILQIELAQKKWGLSVSLSAAYDTNLTLIAEPLAADVPAALQLGASYKLSPEAVGRYSLFASRHAVNSAYNLEAHSLSLDSSLPLTDINMRAGYRFGFNVLDQAVWMTSHTLFSQWQGGSLSAQLNLAVNNYTDSETEAGYSASLNSQWSLPMLRGGVIRPKVSASLGWQGNEALETGRVSLGGVANIDIVANNWLYRPEMALNMSFLPPGGAVTGPLLGRVTLFADRTWSPSFHTSVKADAMMYAATPSDTNYRRNVVTAVLAWSY
jgi:hypothetical protein